MKVASYTPETIRKIRHLAGKYRNVSLIAAELGWDKEFLRSIARRHLIELPAVTEFELVQAAEKAVRGHDISWSLAQREISRGGMVVSLTPKQAHLFDCLFRHWQAGNDGSLHLNEIVARTKTGIWQESIHGADRRLTSLAMSIVSSTGVGGGYRLVVLQMHRAARAESVA